MIKTKHANLNLEKHLLILVLAGTNNLVVKAIASNLINSNHLLDHIKEMISKIIRKTMNHQAVLLFRHMVISHQKNAENTKLLSIAITATAIVMDVIVIPVIPSVHFNN